MNFDTIKSYGGVLFKGLLANSAPTIARGILMEMLDQPVIYKGVKRKIDIRLVIELVNSNAGLWELFGPKVQAQIKNVLGEVSDTTWITADYFIDTIKKEHSALASMFLTRRKAYNWLERQLVELRSNLN